MQPATSDRLAGPNRIETHHSRKVLMIHSSNVLAAAVLLLSLGTMGCGQSSSGTIVTAPIPVTVSHPIKRNIRDYEDFTSRIAAIESVEIRARVGGYLEKINVKK